MSRASRPPARFRSRDRVPSPGAECPDCAGPVDYWPGFVPHLRIVVARYVCAAECGYICYISKDTRKPPIFRTVEKPRLQGMFSI